LKTRRREKLFLLVLSLIFINNCEAPRNNPLDPQNEDNQLAQLTGTVQTESIPHTPLNSVIVKWNHGRNITTTDSQGLFFFDNINREDGWLHFERENYVDDSIFIRWNEEKQINKLISLNHRPIIDSINFYSIVEHRYPSEKRFKAEIMLRISDNDNDTDTVFVTNPTLGFSSPMDFNAATKFFLKSLSLSDLGIESLNEIIGRDFEILVKDNSGRLFNLGGTNIKRIINEEIQIISPINNDTLTYLPFLNWKRFLPGFQFTYLAQIYTNDIIPELVWQKTFSSEEIQYQIDSHIENGDYFWVIWCIDEFYNQSKSKPASFVLNLENP